MVGLELSLPDGMKVVDGSTRGWSFDLDKGVARWSDGTAERSMSPEFQLQAVGPARAGDYELEAAQLYADGHRDQWAVPFAVSDPPPGQNLVAAAILGSVGVLVVVAIVVARNKRQSPSTQ